MYRPAGIYLINLFPLGNWANTVYFMLKTSISRNEIYMYIYIYTSVWRFRQWGWRGKGEGKEYNIAYTAQVELKMEIHMQNRAPIRNKAPKLRHERSQIQGAGACWLQNSHEQRSKPGIRGHWSSETDSCRAPDRQQVSSPEQEGCAATATSDDTGLRTQQMVLSKPPLKVCWPFLGHARTWSGQGLPGKVYNLWWNWA